MERKKISKNKKEKTSNKKIIISVFIICFAFFGSFLIFSILQTTLKTENPMVVVVSGSMEPKIKKGDLLFLRGYENATDLKVGSIENKSGDIIVFNAIGLWAGAPKDPIVHRIVDRYFNISQQKWFFLTKGDANPNVDDAYVSEDRIIGVTCGMIPAIGWIKIFLTDSGLLIPLLVILSVLLIIGLIYDSIKEKKENIIDDNDEDEPVFT